MNIKVCDSYEEMSERGAAEVARLVERKPDCVLGCATGSTPLGVYERLVERARAGKLDFSRVTTFNLDEYRGLARDHEQSYNYYMKRNFFDGAGIDAASTHLPDGACVDGQAECDAYEAAIELAGGIDLQLLGIGHNGHIGFNEPADDFPVRTHVVSLTESTIQANSRLFASADEVPREAYTMGIGTIMKARSILLIANGADKADIVARALTGPVTPRVPASVLQLHPAVSVIVDRQAASCL